MTSSKQARPAPSRPGRTRPAAASRPAVPGTGITVYGCEADEAAVFRAAAPRFGVALTITASAVSAAGAGLAYGNRCVSVGHKTPVANSALLALSRAGVRYVSARSVGYDHIDVDYARSVGIRVGNVAYSPDSVADYTLMLMLMAVRNAKSMIRRADIHDYRLHDARGKELRDLTVGVVGTGRIGSAVLDRLRGFGCRTLAHDTCQSTLARQNPQARDACQQSHVPLDELLERSDIVTLHTPLTADTRHLLDRRRIGQLKQGAFVVNTGRGALLDTRSLLSALESGRLGGAALDVLEGEDGIFYADCSDTPFGNASLRRLQQLPNVIISPHTAYYTDHALNDMVENTIISCLTFERENAAWTS